LDIPGSTTPLLAELSPGADGNPPLVLVSPDQPAISLASGQATPSGNYEYTFVAQRNFAGISVKRDAGAWFIWVATAMLVGGLAITFYLPRRMLWMSLTERGTHVAALAEKS